MKQNKTLDMTHGSLTSILIRFTMPLILSGLLQQLYSWADAFILGNIAGEKALAAAGSTGAITTFLTLAATGFASGISILSARYMGMKSLDVQRQILSSFIIVAGGSFLLAAGILFFRTSVFIHLMGTPDDIFRLSHTYLKIVSIGIPFLAVYNVFAAVLRGIGNSRAPFYAVLLSSVLNVGLDYLFIGTFRLSTAGAAAATVISQILMTLYIIGYSLVKYKILRIKDTNDLLNVRILREGTALSLPIAIQSIVSSAGSLILQNFMNSFGTTTVAAITTAYRVDLIILNPIINLGTGIATVTSQNIGAEKTERVKQCAKTGFLLTSLVAVFLTILVIPSGASLVRMFGVSAEAVEIGGGFFRRIAIFYPVFGIINSMRGFIEGSGKVIISGTVTITGLCIRIALSYLLRPVFGSMVIAWAEAISWSFQAMVLCVIVSVMTSRYAMNFKKSIDI